MQNAIALLNRGARLKDLCFKNGAVYVAYVFTAWLGLNLPFQGEPVTLFWLPSGIGVAAIYRWGWKIIPGIYLAALTINFLNGGHQLTGLELLVNMIIATGNTLGPTSTVYLLKKWQCNLTRLDKHSAFKTIGVTALCMLIPASIGAGTLGVHFDFSLHKTLLVMLVWWMGDSLGILLCAPLLINLSRQIVIDAAQHKRELAIFIVAALLISFLCFPLNQFNNGAALPLAFVPFVCVAWAALSVGLIGGALSTLCFSFIAIWSTVHHRGPFVFPDIHLSYWLIWIYTVVMTLLSMFITAAHREILATTEQLQIANEAQRLQLQHIRELDKALATAATNSNDSPVFFATLLRSLSTALNAQHVAISLVNSEMTQANTHTYLVNGEIKPNFSYSLVHTPCLDALNDEFCFIPEDAQRLYPQDLMLQDINIESYAGIIIRDLDASPIGILIALSENKLTQESQTNLLMRIFADRIASEIRRADDQEKIFNLGFYDPLTQLPNRRLLQDRLKFITAQSEKNQQYGAILFIDIDHFKNLNDTRGHQVGDQLLVLVSERINNHIRKSDLAARLGGDEFVVVFDNLSPQPELAALEAKSRAKELHLLVNQPYSLFQTIHHCTISIGVNIFCGTTKSIDDLLRHADLAMYQAKDSGRNAIRFFDPEMQLQMDLRTSIEADLRLALETEDQLIPYYQVQVNAAGQAIGAELLLRWMHPTKGIISPADFIPIAEQTGLIIPIGRKVIQIACNQLNAWQYQPNFNRLKLAVNVSPIQFNQTDFVSDVLSIVKLLKVDSQLLTFELTEGSLLKNIDSSIEKMLALQANGIGFSIDDFGTGYSSLSYLKKLPLNQLKIDQSFVRDISIDANDRVIVRTIIAMAKNMELEVLAEGVETEEQKNYLLENGCQKFQGYYFGRPAPLADFEIQREKFA